MTDSTVKIGIRYSSSSNDVGAPFGAKGVVKGDQRGMQRALATYVNAHGGAGGRKLQLVEYDFAPGQTSQAMCSGWTEDNKVFAGIQAGGQVPDETLAGCMAKHHALLLTTPFIAGDTALFRRFSPYYYAPRGLEATRMGRDYVAGLADAGFFSGTHKTGLVYYDVPSLHTALRSGVVPALKQRDLTLTQDAAIHYPVNQSQYGDSISAVQGVELKFASEGIDRVLFLDAGGGLAFFFMQSANSQGYHPRYGFNTGSDPAFLAANFDASTLGGSLGMGWVPPADVDMAAMPKSPARTLCLKIMQDAGQPAQSIDDQLVQFNMCSSFFFLKAALDTAAAPTAAAVQEALGRLTELPSASASSLGDGYGPGKAWGAQHYSKLAYNTECACFRYTGPRQPI